jgi:hypothetical protein
MAQLNALSGKLRNDLPEQDRVEVADLVRRVKLKLLRPVWEDNWGDPAAFEAWLADGSPERFSAIDVRANFALFG